MLWNATSDAVDELLAAPDVHEAMRERAPGAGLALALGLLLALAHGVNVYLFASETPVIALLIHMALVAATAVVVRLLILRRLDSRFLMVLLITSAFAGVFGAAGTALAVLLHYWHTRRSLPFTEWFDTMFPSDVQTRPQEVYEAITIGRDEAVQPYDVVPFLEVMAVGSEAQKREAITRMTMRFHPRFAPAFHRALQDESNSIRVQAATAISRVESEFTRRLMELTALYKRMPENPVTVQALAAHYDAYAFTGLLDPERERANREEALRLYRDYVRLEPRDEQARTHVGRLLLRTGQPDAAATWLKECVQQGFRSDTLTGWYMEALYAANRYGELRVLAATINPALAGQLSAEQPQLAESLLLWSGRAAPAAMAGGVV